MPIPLKCACGLTLRAPDASAGKKVKCPKCAAILAVPAVDQAGAAAAAEPAAAPPAAADDSGPTGKQETRPRPRLDEDEDEEDRPSRRSRREDDYLEPAPGFPATVFLAGLAWIGFGLIGLAGTGLNAAKKIDFGRPEPAATFTGPQLAAMAAMGLLSLAFLLAGVQAIRGRLGGLVGGAIGSFLFGLLYCGAGLLTLGLTSRQPPATHGLLMLIALAFALLSMSLLLAGLFALIGRTKYHRWRVGAGLEEPPRPVRSRSRRADEEDDDDRPRRRRRYEEEP